MLKWLFAIPLSKIVLENQECPRCGRSENNFRRLRRGWFDRRVNSIVPCTKYKCWVCGFEGLFRSYQDENEPEVDVAVEL